MPARPIMIAVGGDSGTGKRTLCRGLDAIFGTGRIETVVLDDYHSLDRAQRKLVGYTAADPRASNFAAMEDDLWALREGRAIEKPVYAHPDGTFKATQRLEPHDLVIVQGLFPLYTRALRSLFDVSVWLDPEDDLTAAGRCTATPSAAATPRPTPARRWLAGRPTSHATCYPRPSTPTSL